MRRLVSGFAVVILVLAVIRPAAAEENVATPRPILISQGAIARAVKASDHAKDRVKSLTTPRDAGAALRVQEGQVTEVTEARSFFASRKGIVTIGILGAGIGYATYSKVHDRIHTKNPDR